MVQLLLVFISHLALGIVYCFSRSDSMKVAESLCNRGIQSASYHAYMPSDIKSNAHRLWREGHIQVGSWYTQLCMALTFVQIAVNFKKSC